MNTRLLLIPLIPLALLTGACATITPREMRAWCAVRSVQGWTDTTRAFRERAIREGAAQGIKVSYARDSMFCSVQTVGRR